MIRVADYIVSFIYNKLKVKDIFLVSGGGIMYLTDALFCNKKIKYYCNHHEQASAMAADGYGKTSENMGVAFVTSGPGATNALTGVVGAWQDSTACLYISGQSKNKQTIINSGLKELRQFGVQEVNIIPIVETVTKYSHMVEDADKILYYLEKASFLAKYQRHGPVWLDIPVDIQGAFIDEKKLVGFDPIKEGYIKKTNENNLDKDVKEVYNLIIKSKRPVIVAGNGIRLSKSVKVFNDLVNKLNIPVLTPRLGIDLMATDDKLYIGRPGIKGDRGANLSIQNSDLIISIGARLGINLTGHEYKLFARHAKLIVVDIDKTEHSKDTVKIDKFLQYDAKDFIESLNKVINNKKQKLFIEWSKQCLYWKKKYPVVLEKYKKEFPINTYYFTKILSKLLNQKDIIIIDSGFSSYVIQQSINIKKGQRLIASGGLGAMGYAIPSSIGACIANNKKRIICITGDGSLQMNIQELQTIFHYKLPIKIIIFDNSSYASIFATQHNYFKDRFIGIDKNSGLSFPEIKKTAEMYSIKLIKVEKPKEIARKIKQALDYKGPVICDVKCDKNQQIIPTVYSFTDKNGKLVSKPLEDMYPFLDRKEFLENMLVPPVNVET